MRYSPDNQGSEQTVYHRTRVMLTGKHQWTILIDNKSNPFATMAASVEWIVLEMLR